VRKESSTEHPSLRGKFNGSETMSEQQLKSYQELQRSGRNGEACGDAVALLKETAQQMPGHLLRQLIWHSLPPPRACLITHGSFRCNTAGCLGPIFSPGASAPH
jgi:hypothetical protein